MGNTLRSLLRTTLQRDALSDLEFVFAKRDTETSTKETYCYMNRFSEYLIGYNLTIGVKEHASLTSSWKGVEWCTVDPIEAKEDFWLTGVSGDVMPEHFLELITVTNEPAPPYL